MVDQVLRIRAEADRPVRGVVFMGMGEPLLNYGHATRAARILCHPAGLAIAAQEHHLLHRGLGAGHPPVRAATSCPTDWPSRSTSAIPEKRAAVLPVEKTWPAARAGGGDSRVRRDAARAGDAGLRDDRRLQHRPRRTPRRCATSSQGIPIKVDLIDVTDPTGTLPAARRRTSWRPSAITCRCSGRRSRAATPAARTSTRRAARWRRRARGHSLRPERGRGGRRARAAAVAFAHPAQASRAPKWAAP